MFLGLIIMIQCSGVIAPPRIVVFADGTAEVTTREVFRSKVKIPPEEFLFLQTMSANAMSESTGWLSYVPNELQELAITFTDGQMTRTIPAYVRRPGIPSTIAIADDGRKVDLGAMYRSRRLEMLVDETSTAVGCPDLFDTCQ